MTHDNDTCKKLVKTYALFKERLDRLGADPIFRDTEFIESLGQVVDNLESELNAKCPDWQRLLQAYYAQWQRLLKDQ